MFRHFMKNRMMLLLIAAIVMFHSCALGEYSFTDDVDAIERAADSVLMLEVYSSQNQKIGVGSGFIAFDGLTLVTNYHVIEDGAYIIAFSDDDEEFLISKICITDKAQDIAILQFDRNTGLEPLPLEETEELKRAQKVVAIGSPAGLMNTISIGNISAFYQKDGKDWIQFTAPISSGSSGGALFNDLGNVIGITTATYTSTQNINMAVKIRNVIDLYKKWDKQTTYLISKTTGVAAPVGMQTGQKSEKDNSIVYITASGKKYHNNPNCSKMKSPIAIHLLDAIERGYEPCGKCYK